MKRRQFLQAAATGAIVSGLSAAGWPVESHRVRALAEPGLLQFLDVRCIREIGTEYRRLCPRENASETLSIAIRCDGGDSSDWATSDWQSHLDQRIQDDFSRGYTTQIGGWVLSRTEARQCALYSLLYS